MSESTSLGERNAALTGDEAVPETHRLAGRTLQRDWDCLELEEGYPGGFVLCQLEQVLCWRVCPARVCAEVVWSPA